MRLFLLVAAVLGLAGCTSTGHVRIAQGGEWNGARGFVLYPIEKLRPADTAPDGTEDVIVRLAHNEREAVIFGVTNQGSESLWIEGFEASVPDGGYSLEFYQVEYFTVENPTGPLRGGAKRGRWPDPLIPLEPVSADTDTDGGVLRFDLARPIEVPAGENRQLLVDVFLRPIGAVGHAKSATVDVFFHLARAAAGSAAGRREDLSIRFILDPYRFELPRMQSLQTAVGFGWGGVLGVHRRMASESGVVDGSAGAIDEEALHRDYLRTLGVAKLAPYSAQRVPVEVVRNEAGELRVDWTTFDETSGALLDGVLFDGIGPATTVRFPPSASKLDGSEDTNRFYRLAAEHFRANDWLDRSFYYLFDEPMLREFSEVTRRAERIRDIVPDVPRMVTQPFSLRLIDDVEIWCPQIMDLGDTLPFFPIWFENKKVVADWQTNYSPWIYRMRAPQERTWYYTAMGAQYWTFPDLFIDSDLSDHRAIPWLAFRYSLAGYLNWGTTASYRGGSTPWERQDIWWTNGDGNLLYPAVVGLHNVNRHRAAPSLRMIALREGIDDYEYLRLVESTRSRWRAQRLAVQIVRTSISFSMAESRYQEVRDQAARLIAQ